jgi:hypothetical protein
VECAVVNSSAFHHRLRLSVNQPRVNKDIAVDNMAAIGNVPVLKRNELIHMEDVL